MVDLDSVTSACFVSDNCRCLVRAVEVLLFGSESLWSMSLLSDCSGSAGGSTLKNPDEIRYFNHFHKY